ncbi:MAG: GNAT family N-acetyltransferase [Chloroflexi bacterium]|nr:GNAT family N-acetyltransferase [Chloroflexota bacterium]
MPITVSTLKTLPTLRREASELLNEFDAADGLAAYYTLHHEDRRTTLAVSHSAGQVDGFLVRCMTGIDLFRPLVTLRLRGDAALPDLLEQGMVPGHPALLAVPMAYHERLEPHLDLSAVEVNHILRLNPTRFHPQRNVIVAAISDPRGSPRMEIRRYDQVVAAAGINWRSPIFAEVYVHVKEAHRLQGWGRAVLTTLISTLLKMEITPLYTVAETNGPSRELAASLGFVDTGAREIMANAVLPG